MIDIIWVEEEARPVCRYSWKPEWGNDNISVLAIAQGEQQEIEIVSLHKTDVNRRPLNSDMLTPGFSYRLVCRQGEIEIPLLNPCEFTVPYDAQIRYFLGKRRRNGWQEMFIKARGSLPFGSLMLCKDGNRLPLPHKPQSENEIFRYLICTSPGEIPRIECMVELRSTPHAVNKIVDL